MKRKIINIGDIKKYIIISIVVIVSGYIVFNYIDSIKSESDIVVAKSLSSQMNQSNSFISKYLDGKIELLNNIGKSLKGKDFKSIEELKEYMSVLVDGNEFQYVSVIDSEGNLYLPDNSKIDVRDKPYYVGAFQGKIIISRAIDEMKFNYDTIAITVPIYDGKKVMGAVFAIKDAEELQEELTANFNENLGFCYIIDNDGHVIFRAKNEYTDNEFTNFYHYMAYNDVNLGNYVEEVRTNLAAHNSGVINVKNSDGSGYLGYDSISKNSDWGIVSYSGNDKILEYGKSVSKKSLQMTTFIVAMILFVAVYIIKEEIDKKKECEKIYSIDPLTKINSIAGFTIEAKKLIEKYPNNTYAMAVFDIPKFKYINHIYGYSYGDMILKSMAKSLSKRFTKEETCARVSADNFIILAKYNDKFIEAFEKELSGILYFGRNSVLNNYKIGLYVIANKEEPINIMLDKVDCAWKYIKNNSSKSIKFYNEVLMDNIVEEERLQSKMENSLRNDEFQVYLQPKINLETSKICGAEALARWISDDMGVISPDKFIPLFEKNGFVVKLDFFILEEMIKKMKELKNEGINNFTISVNQSRATICDPMYINKLIRLISKYQVTPSLIELEVTESIFTVDYEEVLSVIAKAKHMGFKISMDDFGSGYSSLNLLKEMPINELKLDRMFLNETSTSIRSKLIITNIIAMAKALEIDVICEGVETLEQAEFLKEIKCDMAQGYYFGKPMAMAKFEEILRSQIYNNNYKSAAVESTKK